VLDKGHVRLIDVMGDDSSIVQAARVSYGKGTKSISEDRGLIRYLMRHRHTTPFEMVEFKFHVRVPMDCWRQWIRHRTASVNEYSTRYSEAIDDKQSTSPREWRAQSVVNKQGSDSMLPVPVGNNLSANEAEFHRHADALYKDRLQAGVAREQARKDLPLSTYTEAYWKIDLHNLFHFLGLRMDPHAQLEIRQYANAIAGIVKECVPLAWEAFEEYRLGAFYFSKTEARYLAACMNDCQEDRDAEWDKLSGREQFEMNSKLERMGVGE
jgi:thymidylate synthase (FAD)